MPCIDALTALIGRSAKHPILINEAVIALSLLSTHKDGGRFTALIYIIIVLTYARPVGLVYPSSTSAE